MPIDSHDRPLGHAVRVGVYPCYVPVVVQSRGVCEGCEDAYGQEEVGQRQRHYVSDGVDLAKTIDRTARQQRHRM